MIMQLVTEHLNTFASKEKQRFKLKVGVFLFLVQNEQILLLRRFKTGIDDGRYVVPMGGHDGQEPLTLAIIREAYEEANIILKPSDVRVCHVMHRFHPMPNDLSFEQMDTFFYADKFQGTIKNNEPEKCDELKFYPIKSLPIATVPFIAYAIDCMLRRQLYSEFGW